MFPQRRTGLMNENVFMSKYILKVNVICNLESLWFIYLFISKNQYICQDFLNENDTYLKQFSS